MGMFRSRDKRMTSSIVVSRPAFQAVVFAGIIGGVAEIAWIALYAQFTTLDTAFVSRQVVASFSPALADAAWAPGLGVAIHLTLSVLLAVIAGLSLWLPLAKK